MCKATVCAQWHHMQRHSVSNRSRDSNDSSAVTAPAGRNWDSRNHCVNKVTLTAIHANSLIEIVLCLMPHSSLSWLLPLQSAITRTANSSPSRLFNNRETFQTCPTSCPQTVLPLKLKDPQTLQVVSFLRSSHRSSQTTGPGVEPPRISRAAIRAVPAVCYDHTK